MEAVKVLYVSQEVFPYLPESEMSKISRQLPQSIQELGREIRTFMPRYGCVNERRNQLHEVIRLSGMNIIIDDTDHQLIIKVASIQSARMQIYFIDNDDYFHRKSVVTDENGKYFDDNDDRAIFFARGVLETVKKLRWSPDIIHCHGWMSAVLPLYVKTAYHDDPFFAKSKVVYSIYDNEFTNTFDNNLHEKIKLSGITDDDLVSIAKPCGYIDFSKLAIDFSDGVIQASKEIKTELLDYAAQKNKLVMPYQEPENFVAECNAFYDKVLSER